MKTVSSTILLITILYGFSMGQPYPDTLWTRTYRGGYHYSVAHDIQQTTDGGYIIVGYGRVSPTADNDVYLVKTDSNGDTLWTRIFGGSENDNGYSVQQTFDGGYIVGGQTSSYGAGDFDFYLVKTDSFGDTLWTQTYGGIESEQPKDVQQTSDSGYIFVGHSYSYNGLFYFKTDNNGDTLWTRTYGGGTAFSVQQTYDGGFILAGSISGDIYLVKTDNLGDTLWTKTYGGNSDDIALDVKQTLDGGYILAGRTYSFGAGGADMYILNVNSIGDTLWTRTFGGLEYDMAQSVWQTDDEGYIITGWGYIPPYYDSDFYLLKVENDGDILWSRTYGGAGSEMAYSVQQTMDRGYIMAGTSETFGNGFYVVKTGPESPPSGHVSLISWGPPDWGYRLHHVSGALSRLEFTNFCVGTTGWVSGNAATSWSMLPNGDGNDGDSIIFVTSTPLTSGTIDTFWLSHPTCSDLINWQAGDSTGTVSGPLPVELTTFEAIPGDGQVRLHWETQSETDNDHFALYKRIASTSEFNVLTTIPGQGTTTQLHKYNYTDRLVVNGITYQYQISDVDINGVENLHDIIASATPQSGSTIPVEYALHQNYPNPFNPTTTIRYDVKAEGLVTLQVFNLIGQEIATLVNEVVGAGSYTIKWDASGLPSGIYLYRMEVDDFHQAKKLILLK